MREFIEELKYNKKINEEKGLENRVDVDYVIEKLEEIDKCLTEEIDNLIKYSKENVNYMDDMLKDCENKDLVKARKRTYEDYLVIMNNIKEDLTSKGVF